MKVAAEPTLSIGFFGCLGAEDSGQKHLPIANHIGLPSRLATPITLMHLRYSLQNLASRCLFRKSSRCSRCNQEEIRAIWGRFRYSAGNFVAIFTRSGSGSKLIKWINLEAVKMMCSSCYNAMFLSIVITRPRILEFGPIRGWSIMQCPCRPRSIDPIDGAKPPHPAEPPDLTPDW